MKDSSNRFPVIDAFKAIASQLIVLHHLAAYGPISDAVQKIAPTLISWLYDYARMAVQVFLVIGGYLAARSISTSKRNLSSLTITLFNRYLRLAIPFFAALILAIFCAIYARQWLTDDFVPDKPTIQQLLAHVFMLQSMLDFDALLAGAWFIAIDFQLFLLMLSITWLSSNAKNSRNIKLSIITLMVTISLFWFNRSAGFDDWAVYFFGAYGLGSVAFLAGNRRQFNNLWFWLNVTLATVAIFVDFRARILIAVLVTLILFFSREAQLKEALIGKKIIHYLGKISYSIFLVHFSILMLANSIFVGFNLSSPYVGLISMFVAWVVSILAADLFYNRVEKYFSMILKRHIKSLSQS